LDNSKPAVSVFTLISRVMLGVISCHGYVMVCTRLGGRRGCLSVNLF